MESASLRRNMKTGAQGAENRAFSDLHYRVVSIWNPALRASW